MKLPHKIAVHCSPVLPGVSPCYRYVPGLVLPGLLFGITDFYGYGLTHIPTGYKVVDIATKKNAIALAKALQELPINWNFTDVERPKRWKKTVREKARALIDGARYK